MNSSYQNHLLPQRIILLCACLLLCSLSCASYTSQKNTPEGFSTAIKAFNASFRWGEYKTAAAFIPAAQQQRFWAMADEFNRKVRIVDYEVRQTLVEVGSTTGIAILSFRYYYTTDPKIQTKTVQQTWFYLEKEKLWKISDDGLSMLLQAN